MVIDFDTGVVDWIIDWWLDIIDESELVGRLVSISDCCNCISAHNGSNDDFLDDEVDDMLVCRVKVMFHSKFEWS